MDPRNTRYYLEFLDKTGTDQDYFCTFRLGKLWFHKLALGYKVWLAHKTFIYDEATVVMTEVGPASMILKQHAKYSHLELANFPNAKRSAPQRRFESLQKLYGPHKFNEDSSLTAIFLRR